MSVSSSVSDSGGAPTSPSYDASNMGGIIPMNSETQQFKLPNDLERLAQTMGKKLGPDGTKAMEVILQGMLMNMINQSRDASQQFTQMIQQASDENSAS